MKTFRLLTGILLTLSASVQAMGAPSHATVSLIPESTRFESGREVRVAFIFSIQPGWHAYWTNPGTAGEPPRVVWDLPKGWKDRGLRFPVPDRFQEGDAVAFGYKKAVTILGALMPPPGKTSGTQRLTARLTYLLCKDVCVGEERVFQLSLKPGTPGAAPKAILESEKDIPPDTSLPSSELRRAGFGRWVLEVPEPPGADADRRYVFIPRNLLGVDLTREIAGQVRSGKIVFPVRIQRGLLAEGRIEGVVRQEGRRGGWSVSAAAPENPSVWPWVIPFLLLAGIVWTSFRKGRAS